LVFRSTVSHFPSTQRQSLIDFVSARYLRQTLIFSEYLAPEMNSVFTKKCLNVAGKVKIRQAYRGTINDVPLQVQQVMISLFINIHDR
jgi:ribosomal protein S26